MQDIITKGTEDVEYPEKIIKFSQLRYLELQYLPNLECFYGGSYNVEFPKLKKLTLFHLPMLTAFVMSEDSTALFCEKVEFPYLEELEMTNVIKDTHTQLLTVKDAPKLRKLTIDNIKGLRLIPSTISLNLSSLRLNNDNENTVIFSTSEASENEDLVKINPTQLPKLEHLCVKDFERLEYLFENEDNGIIAALSVFCGQLKHLELENLQKLKHVALPLFKNIRTLRLQQLNWKYIFPSDLVLEMLEDIEITDCEVMNYVVAQEEHEGNGTDRDIILFPRLKTLTITRVSISSFSFPVDAAIQFPSLETLKIMYCHDLNAFSSGPLVAPKLKEVELFCQRMQSFFSGHPSEVIELPSLQRVFIQYGDIMKSFSTRPLIAPNLREVVLDTCEDMHWFSPAYPNQDDVLDLPSLELLHINDTNMRTFTTGSLKAPKLTQVAINYQDYSIQQIHNLNDFLQNLYKNR